MSSTHCVVVWEYESEGQWLPHSPGVARALERAHAKKLTRVVLADADPDLKGHCVNLRTLTQSFDTPDGGTVECGVRRTCYSAQAAGGRWEWARLSAPPHAADLRYEPMTMQMQCALEAAWQAGADVVSAAGWALSVRRGTARRQHELRLLRRAHQPPYPRHRHDCDPPQVPGRRIPQQHTGSSVHSLQSTHSNASAHSNLSAHSSISAHSDLSDRSLPARAAPSGTPRPGARSASPKDRKPGLARQILHNLNIFSTAGKQQSSSSSSSVGGARRHSVDTVSTYLSHGSKDSLQRGSVGELLDCSGSSDDAFEAPPPDAGEEEALPAGVAAWCAVVRRAQWGALCPACLGPLSGAAASLPCHHMLHVACLRDQVDAATEAAAVECGVCGARFGPRSQPPGSMAWRAHRLDDRTPAILVTYSFRSGRQSPGQPSPGAPYYAVGFPRHSLLPDDELGRRVLAALRTAWERGVLFRIRASQTTGREHVVAWSVAPPPSDAAAYAHADRSRLLAAALRRLLDLIAGHAGP